MGTRHPFHTKTTTLLTDPGLSRLFLHWPHRYRQTVHSEERMPLKPGLRLNLLDPDDLSPFSRTRCTRRTSVV